ncbi:MAG: signal peptidase I [Oscillospiraceae bacterium]|nr:signal peptidase I [Oscillospiraceae bacterium]
MKTNNLKISIIICTTIVLLQIVFMMVPLETLRLYNTILRPLTYAFIAMVIFVLIGLDKRPVPKGYDSTIVAAFSVSILVAVLFVISLLFGANTNVMAANMQSIITNLWERGSIVILGAYIRYKLIKRSNNSELNAVLIIVTISIAFGQMHAIRMLIDGDAVFLDIFFNTIFTQLVISAVASYFAIKGNFISVLLISFVYIMLPYLSPILPYTTPLIFFLIVSGLAFLTAVIYRHTINDKKRIIKKREKRYEKYFKKRPIISGVITASIIGVIIAFFIGMFPIYPIVVLTGSMAGTYERGSLVFIERVPENEAYIRVGEGYVIHFVSHNRVAYIHRVVEFRHNAYGERQYITKGDANESVDIRPVTQDNVLGIARASIPFFGYPYIFFRSVFNTLN